MALVTDYASLKTHLAEILNRSDLTSVIPNFIQQFEAGARDDERLIRLTDRGVLTVSADGTLLPTDLFTIESWYHDGPTYYGPITVVAADQIGRLKGERGDTGVPQFAAITAGRARFAPEPDAAYATAFTYWQTVTPLSDSVTTNWLLLTRPDIYITGALVEAYLYLKDEERAAGHAARLENMIERHHMASVANRFGGTVGGRQFTPIGG